MEKKIALTGEGELYVYFKDEKTGVLFNIPNHPIGSTPISVEYSTLNEGANDAS